MKRIARILMILIVGYATSSLCMERALVQNSQNQSAFDYEHTTKNITHFVNLFDTNKLMQSNKQLYAWLSEENRSAIFKKKIINTFTKTWLFIRDRIYRDDTASLEMVFKGKNPDEKNSIVNAPDYIGRSFLGIALDKGYQATAELLLDHGAQVNLQPTIHPLIKAAHDGHLTIVQKLLTKIDKDQARDTINQAFIAAADNHQTNIVELLCNNGADINYISNNEYTALIIAACFGYTDIVQLLLSKRGINIHIYNDKNRKTALMYAAANGHTDIVQLLLNHGAQIHEADRDGMTAVVLASRNAHKDTVKLLLNNGANVHLRTVNNNTILLHEAGHGHLENIELILDRGAKVNTRNNDEETALMAASHGGFTDIIQCLLSHGADVNAVDVHGQTALMWTATNNHTDSMKLLLAYGADVHMSTILDHHTALMHAATDGNIDIVKLLLYHGAEIDQVDKGGQTALYFAQKAGHYTIVELLNNWKSASMLASLAHEYNAHAEDKELSVIENDIALPSASIVERPKQYVFHYIDNPTIKETNTNNSVQPRHKCFFPGCNKSYARKGGLIKHIKNKHDQK
jgi:ankyrin repeat protein